MLSSHTELRLAGFLVRNNFVQQECNRWETGPFLTSSPHFPILQLTVEPMLSFITKVTAVNVTQAAAGAKPLREQVTLQFARCCPPGIQIVGARLVKNINILQRRA